jgi:hypothetical protein
MTVGPNEKLKFPTVGTDPKAVRQRVEAMEKVLERLFIVPGLNRPVGLDVILDLVPGVGDVAGRAVVALAISASSSFPFGRMPGGCQPGASGN